MCYSLSVRQILFASDAIKTIDDEESYLIVYCLNCILHNLMCIPGFMLAIGCIVRSSFYKACGTRRISFASNATSIMRWLIIFCLNCVLFDRNATYKIALIYVFPGHDKFHYIPCHCHCTTIQLSCDYLLLIVIQTRNVNKGNWLCRQCELRWLVLSGDKSLGRTFRRIWNIDCCCAERN